MHPVNIDPWFLEKARKSRDGRLNAHESLAPQKTALVVVDMQNYFVAEGMPSYVPEAKTIVPNINRLARAVRASGGLVVWIQTEARPAEDWHNRRESLSVAGWDKRQAQLGKGSEGFALYPTCEVKPEDRIALKYRYSAFIPYPSDLEHALRERGIDTLLITGTTTSTCCESTARDASMWGYRTIMVSDGTADALDSHHNHTLGKFLVTFGDMQSTDELVGKLAGQGAAAEPVRALAGAK